MSTNMDRQQSISTLFNQYHLELKSFIKQSFRSVRSSEDIVQDAFYKMIAMQDIEKIDNPRAYLYQTARNLALNTLRKDGRDLSYMASLTVEDDLSIPLFRQYSGQKDLERINAALQNIPEKYRKTFLMNRVEDKSYKEISDELGIAISTVEKHIVRVLKHLRTELAE